MMENMDGYILSVTAAATICAIAVKLTGNKGTQGAMIKLIAGLLLTFTVIQPLAGFRLEQWDDWTLEISDNATIAAGEGEAVSRQAWASCIKSYTQAYILDKAEALGLSLEIEITLSGDDIPVPIAIRLEGNASPYAKNSLTATIEQDLGISREDQKWI